MPTLNLAGLLPPNIRSLHEVVAPDTMLCNMGYHFVVSFLRIRESAAMRSHCMVVHVEENRTVVVIWPRAYKISCIVHWSGAVNIHAAEATYQFAFAEHEQMLVALTWLVEQADDDSNPDPYDPVVQMAVACDGVDPREVWGC